MMAVYWDRGAELRVPQRRAPPAFKASRCMLFCFVSCESCCLLLGVSFSRPTRCALWSQRAGGVTNVYPTACTTAPARAREVDGVWCNPREGVWKNFPAVPGAAARSLSFGTKLREEGDRRAVLRKACGKKIRKEMGRGIARASVAALEELLEEANKLRGSRLMMDARNATIFLERKARAGASARFAQRVFRGVMGRNASKAQKASRRTFLLIPHAW